MYYFCSGNKDSPISKKEFASLCAKIERYIGIEGGGMDQAIAMLAEEGCAKLIDFIPELSSKTVPLPQDANFYITHSGVECKKAATSYYNIRVVETKLAAAIIAKKNGIIGDKFKFGDQLWVVQQQLGLSLDQMVQHLQTVFDINKDSYSLDEICQILELSPEQVKVQFLAKVSEPITDFKVYQRALHVFEEANRVQQFCRLAVSSKDITLLGELMNESHLSCKDNYECSHLKLDELVEIALASGAVGSRLTGAGWGGCIVSLVPTEKTALFEENVSKFSKFNCKSRPSGGPVIYLL